MKNYMRIIGLVITGLLLALPKIQAQSYTISSYKIAGGGGTSANGPFSVSGAVGLHNAGGAMTGGGYSLTAAAWSSITVVQTSGGPSLTIAASGNQVVILWPPSATGWTLQTNSNLSPGSWGNYSGHVINNSVTNSPQAGNLFFRLMHP